MLKPNTRQLWNEAEKTIQAMIYNLLKMNEFVILEICKSLSTDKVELFGQIIKMLAE